MGATYYSNGQVARILNIEPLRVKNFGDVDAYSISGVRFGRGRGSRRMFRFTDLLRIAIADELSRFGFDPYTVGKAIRELRDSDLTRWTENLYERSEGGKLPKDLPMLTLRRDKPEPHWSVTPWTEVEETIDSEFRGVFVLNYANLLDSVVHRITELAGKGEL